MKSKINSDYVPLGEPEHSSEVNSKFILSKFDNDFFDDEKYIKEKIIRVKRIASVKKPERWNIFENNKIIFVVDGIKISKKEREYLRTVAGFNFLVLQGRKGIKSLNALKKELKKVLL